jgi:hypothetical protein
LVLDCKQVSATQADDELACISGVSAVLGKVRCFLDPRVGHLLRRVEYLSADGADSLITRVEVIEFSEPKPGIYFPKTAQISGPGRPLFEVRVKSARINEPIPERDLQITLPAGIRVYEPAKGLIHIWGANGRPEQTFSNEEQLGSWEKEMARKLTGAPEVAAASGAAAIVLFANLGLVLLIGVLIYIRRRLSTSSTRLE